MKNLRNKYTIKSVIIENWFRSKYYDLRTFSLVIVPRARLVVTMYMGEALMNRWGRKSLEREIKVGIRSSVNVAFAQRFPLHNQNDHCFLKFWISFKYLLLMSPVFV